MENENDTIKVYKLNITAKQRLKNIKTPLQFLIYNLVVAKIDNSLKVAEVKDKDLIINISKREILENLKLVKLQSSFKLQVAELSQLQVENYYKDNDSFRFINIFSYIDYSNNILTAKINKDIIYYFIDLGDGNFFKYHFSNLIKFKSKSKYTILLYELLKSDYFLIKKKYYIDYDYSFLLQQLQVKSPSIKQFFNFRIKVLEKSIQEINDSNVDIKIKYKKLLNGKTVEKIRFFRITNVNDKILTNNEKKELEKLRRYKANNQKKYTICDNEYYQELEENRINKIIEKEEDIPF